MLKLADIRDAADIEAFLGRGIIPLRIRSYMLAYGFDKEFVKFWISKNENTIDGVLALFEDTLLLHIKGCTDISEITSFISMLHFNTLSCEKGTAEICGFDNFVEKQGLGFNGNAEGYTAENIDEKFLKSAYTLICDYIPDSFENSRDAYCSFLSDYTYRKRRNLARGKCIIEDEKLISCAFTSAETANEALLSGIATERKLQKSGYGKKTVLSLVNELLKDKKLPYVIALNDSAISFYEHIGFKKNKTIAYINRKDI